MRPFIHDHRDYCHQGECDHPSVNGTLYCKSHQFVHERELAERLRETAGMCEDGCDEDATGVAA